jgi:hypothetical protein
MQAQSSNAPECPLLFRPSHERWDILRDPAPAAWAPEAAGTIGYPIVPVGKTTQAQSIADGNRKISFGTIGWQLVLPSRSAGDASPSTTVLDVYVGLLYLYALAGFPEDGRVNFSRYALLSLLRWVSHTTQDGAQVVVKPSGKHYRNLEDALMYLSQTLMVNKNPDVVQYDIDGSPFQGSQGFPILQYYRLPKDSPGPRAERELQGRSYVVFSKAFTAMLGGGARVTQIDWGLYLSLPSGMPRHLFRFLTWLRQEGRSAPPIGEVFARVGSTQADHRPARARQILDKAHASLRRAGVLSADPAYEKDPSGQYCIRYAFGDPNQLLGDEEFLVRAARGLGVTESVARELAVANRQQLERVLAAAVLGFITPRNSLGSMIVHYTRRALPIREHPGQEQEPADLPLQGQGPDRGYISWLKKERDGFLKHAPDVDEAAVWQRARAAARERSREQQDWVIEGLAAIRINSALNLETFSEYLDMQRPGKRN